MSQPFMAPGPGAQPPYGSGPIAGVQPPGAMTMHPNTPVNGMYSPPTSGAPPHPGPPTMKAMPPTSTDGLTNGHFNGPQQPHRMPGYGGPADNQISNQMSNMNMNGVPQGAPKQPGMPPMQHNMSGPSQMHQNVPATGMPSYNQGMPRQTGPPSGYGMPPQNQLGMPPHSQANIPNQPSMPPHSQAGIPPSNQLGMPPHSQAGIPPSNQLGMPPHSQAGMPPSNQLGMPPHSQAGMPPSNQPSMLPHSQASIQQQPSMPPSNEPGMPPQPVMPPSNQHGMPPQPGMPLQPGMPPQPYGMPGQPPMSQPPGGSSFPPAHDGYNQPGMQPPSGPPTGPYGAQMPKPVPGMMAGPTTPGSYPPNMAPGQQPPGPGGYPAPSGPHPAQHQQPRRLNPDQMPSHIQVVEDDRRNKEGLFETGQRGALPPLVTTDFIVEDRGNCSPRFIRSSLYHVPCTADLLKSSNVPFALSITPFAKLHAKEEPPHCVDLGSLGPVRCNRCKAYMCPYMQFIDGGRRFQCCFCGCATEVPPEYFAHLDHTGRRTDAYERPELCSGAYDMVATEDYCRDNKLPNTPAFIFMLDVSYNSVKSGLVHLMCSRMKEVLQCLPREYGADESEVRIGFVTYDKEIHFYNVKGNLSQPQMLVVSDIQDVFVPLIDGFLVKLSESEAVIDSLLEQIPLMFTENTQTEIVLGPVIQAGLDAMKAADCTGKLFIFHSSLPNATAPGQLKNRDDRKLLGTEKEKTLLGPVSNFYTKLGQECVSIGCGVDLFLFPNSYVDVATIGEVPRLTGGQIYKYTYFQADLDGGRFIDDLKDNLTRNIAFDVTMRVRTSTGIRPVDFLGNFYMSNTTDIELAVVDSNKCVTVEVKHDDKLNEAEGACIQAAVLYTSISGQRRLRILNLSLNCCTQMSDLYRNCELDVIINHMAKKALRETLNSNPKQMRDQIMSQSVNILACYRKNCSNQSAEGQLILPEAMKLLPVYSNCIIKSTAVQGTEIHTDDRSWLMNLVNSMSVVDTNVFFYPTLLPLHDMDVDSSLLPGAMRCSYERLSEQGVYLLENGLSMYLWLGINVNPEWVQNVFGVQSAAQIDIDKTQLHDFDNPLSRRVRQIIKKICVMRNRHMKLIIVRQRDKLEPIFQQYLVEDRGSNGSASYVDYLCHIHKEIRSLLT